LTCFAPQRPSSVSTRVDIPRERYPWRSSKLGGFNCVMAMRLVAVSTGKLSTACRSPTNRPYGSGRFFPSARTACALPAPKRSSHTPVSASRDLLRERQGHLGGAIPDKIGLLERLRGFSRRALPRLWRGGSGFRPAQVRYMRRRTVVDAQLQTEGSLSVMRCQARRRFRRLSQRRAARKRRALFVDLHLAKNAAALLHAAPRRELNATKSKTLRRRWANWIRRVLET